MKNKKLLMIVDGHALIHRAFHGLPPTMRTRSGEVVNAVYGFTSILLKSLSQIKPDYVAVTFDLPKKTFRDGLYKEYKAHRVKAPDELYAQIPRVREVVKAFNIPVYEKEGYEADDVVATLSDQHEKADKEAATMIVTGDLDSLQLVDDQTKVFTLRKGFKDTVIYDEQAVQDRYGLKSEQMIDYKALAGDASDNIPGVSGVGDKTATNLLSEYKDLAGVYKEAKKADSKIKETVRKKLLADEKKAWLSQELATIIREVPGVKLDLNKCLLKDYDRGKVVELFQELQFQSLLGKLPEVEGKTELAKDRKNKKGAKRQCVIINDKKSLASFVSKIEKADGFTFDTETDSLDANQCNLVGVSFSWEEDRAYYLNLFSKDFCQKMAPIFSNKKQKKSGHNLKYDLSVLRGHGVEVEGPFDDTMIISYLLDPGTRAHNLDQLAFSELGYEMQPIEDLIGKGKKQITFDKVPLEKAADYSCEDAEITFRLQKKLLNKLEKVASGQKDSEPFIDFVKDKSEPWDLVKMYRQIEMPLLHVLADMEKTGVKLDKEILQKASKETKNKLDLLEKEIYEMAGKEFKINSPGQLSVVLFEDLNLPTEGIKKGKTAYSTAASQLDKLKGKHEIIEKIFSYRELTKLQNTYLQALPKLVCAQTGRLHTSFNQTVTATGRLSSSDPNLQNIPVRTKEGEVIRRAFVARDGYKFLSLDYSQIDLRVLAHYSKDKNLVEAFKNKRDIHTEVAARIFEKSREKVSSNDRRIAKVVNFGLVYGMSAFGLSQTLQVERGEAKKYIENYFEKHPQVKKYMDDIVTYAQKTGYVETLFGRRRYLPEVNSSQYLVRSSAERMAINMPIQGSASDIVKLAMISVQDKLSAYKDEAKLLLQVHDELLMEVKTEHIDEVTKKCVQAMENCCQLDVPLTVHGKVGENWADLEDF